MGWSQEDKGATVLIADDDESQLFLLEQTLLLNQFSVLVAHNGIEAVELFHQHCPDVVLLDVDMPEMDGFTACEQIRSNYPELTVPIVMVTGMDDVESIEKAYAVGADDFIVKPLSWPVLGHRVYYYLKGSRALSEIKERNEREKTLFRALPDIVIRFNEACIPIDIHTGKHEYLFSDGYVESGQFDEFALVEMIQDLIRSNDTQAKQQFEEAFWLNDKLNHVEIRVASSQNNDFIVVVRDISQRKENEQRIMNLVLYDQLTDLPNRRYLEDELERYVSDSNNTLANTNSTSNAGSLAQEHRNAALVFINVERFSKLYESFGLKVGDELVKSIAGRLKDHLVSLFQSDHLTKGAGYRLFRFSENEFAVLLTRLFDTNETFRVSQVLLDCMAKPFSIANHEIYVSLSIGIAFYPEDSTDSVKLIEMAGQAVHLAQSASSHVSCYSADFDLQAQRKLKIEKHLRKALEKNELYLVFQPKMCISDPTRLSAEVLMRWVNDELGFISPGEFIPIAEQDEIILDISRWLVEQAFKLNSKLYHHYGLDVKLAINLSPQQFVHQPELVKFFADEVAKVNMKPSNFELEITENVLIDDVDFTSDQLKSLRQLGFSIAIDDFGTGYSSMSYLTRFSIDTLKIDQSFINTFDDPRNRKLIETLIVMGKKLNMKTVAEGVETEEQLNFLVENKCDYVQGYFYAKPLTFDNYVEFLKSLSEQPQLEA